MSDSNQDKNVRVRFAPSPTGDPHLGAMRTALFNWAFAKKGDGKFILRIEDTDKKRQVKGSVENIIDSLKWLGIDYDEGPILGGEYGPYIQSERSFIYKKVVARLIDEGNAYMCDLTPEELSKMRENQISQGKAPGYNGYSRNRAREELEKSKKMGKPVVVRLKVPLKGTSSFNDLRRGKIQFDLSNIDDFVILKADGLPTYHLANVVDDSMMKISHVLRGEEWISSTPKHLLIYGFLKKSPPKYIHLPLIFGNDKSKLSKRHGAKSIIEYINSGLIPESILNYLALLGWSPVNDKEVFSMEDFIKMFDIKRLNTSPSIFDPEKLEWINGVHIRNTPDDELGSKIYEYMEINATPECFKLINKARLKKIVPLIKERIKSFEEVFPLIKFFFKYEKPNIEQLSLKSLEKKRVVHILINAISQMTKLNIKNRVAHIEIEAVLRSECKNNNLNARDYLGLIRYCVTGSKISPPLFESIQILGLKETITRIQQCVVLLKD